MTWLDSAQISAEKKNGDPASISSLQLSHRALSDVSCLKDFANLEKLDISFNNLSTLEGLRSCINLKWLSVVQNKLQSLRGIEELSKLTVLNAGRNKLRSMDEVISLISLRALILNDNDIAFICNLDRLKHLNTLVLSRNPIQDIGDSLVKMKSITKLSLSNCQLQAIGSSLTNCVDLKEVRLAHNEIMTLPTELAHNVKIQNLDIGNNLIQKWSDLKVLSFLHNLKNLNLQGNPIAEKENLPTKIGKVVPNLQIFNGKPTVRGSMDEKISKKEVSADSKDDYSHKNAADLEAVKEEKRRKPKTSKGSKKNASLRSSDDDGSPHNAAEPDKLKVEKDSKRRKPKKVEESKLEVIDDGETPFMEIISGNVMGSSGKKRDREAVQDKTSLTGVVSVYSKKKNAGIGTGHPALQFLALTSEVGMGGPSTWDDA
ncbi:uncharacterized protein LOC131234501 [Magnolia sinica]|uniref:uncharacterized protein LOC131234501 n=1 Tax=Magnolia sinica TaxID=86752 RepID=UPI002657AE7E|nr:uncharacterized protein LOC131234501 [Magnolia sinica]